MWLDVGFGDGDGDGDIYGDKCGDGHGDKCVDSVVSVAGSEGGALVAAGLGNNSSVIILDNTNNGIDLEDETAVC